MFLEVTERLILLLEKALSVVEVIIRPRRICKMRSVATNDPLAWASVSRTCEQLFSGGATLMQPLLRYSSHMLVVLATVWQLKCV